MARSAFSIKRRDFLKSTLPTVALVQSGLQEFFISNQAQGSPTAADTVYDLIVIGGSLTGCFAAHWAAQQGHRVLLIERRTFLGTDITATLRPWLKREGLPAFYNELKPWFLPDEERAEIGIPFDPRNPSKIFADDVPLFMGTVKKQFMQNLVQSNVHVLIGTGVWGVLTDRKQNKAAGLVLANRFGLHTVRSQNILDTRSQNPQDGPVSFSLELYDVKPNRERAISVPGALGLLGDKVYIHAGKRKPGQCFAEFRFMPTQTDVEGEARQRVEGVCGHLIRTHPHFVKARVEQMAWETLRTAGRGAQISEPSPSYEHYHHLCTEPTFRLTCQDVLHAWHQARRCIDTSVLREGNTAVPASVVCAAGTIPLDQCQPLPVDNRGDMPAIQRITFPFARYLPTSGASDVIVAGGGTAGAMATLGSLQEGATTTTVEFLSELGGTSTVGRVTGYYAGYRETDFYRMIEEETRQQSQRAGRCGRGVARMLAYRRKVKEAGGTLLTNCIVCGVTKRGRSVTGLVIEQEGRLSLLAGKLVIDATGEGDVAVFAGASFDLGNQRMRCTQNYSQWDVNPGLAPWQDSTTNRDHDILWSHEPPEWQRGYRLSHRRAHYYDFTPFLTVRESRRIKGDYTLTLRDVILKRRHSDTICLAASDFDPHHFGDTIFTRAGCLLPHQVTAVVEIPYRAILPRGIDNLLVSAKAISQTHNAMQFTRMSFDIMTLGYVTGRLAARIVEQGIQTREFDVSALQKKLRDMKILPGSTARASSSPEPDDPLVDKIVEELASGTQDALLKMMMLSAQAAEPSLHKAYDLAQNENQRLRLAKALAWFGNPAGKDLILAEMKTLCAEERASGRLPREYYREDQGTPYWTINQDLALLALSGDPTVLPDILSLADTLKLDQPPVIQSTKYNQGRIDLRLIPYYNRIITLCSAIERTPDKRAIRPLSRMLDAPHIRDQVSQTPSEAGEKVYGGILESRLAATLARCGGRRGFMVLTAYLDDIHPMLACYARQELRTLLDRDLGFDSQLGRNYLMDIAFPRAPRPYLPKAMEW